MSKKRFIGPLIVSLAILYLLPLHAGASSDSTITFSIGENSASLTDTKDVFVNNGEENASISIEENGETLFENNVDAIYIQSIDPLTESDKHYAIITYRYVGSSNALYFDVLQLGDTRAENIYTSEPHERATMDITDNHITLQYPDYKEGDVMTEPSEMVTETLQILDNTVTSSDKDVQALEHPSGEDAEASNKYNPSYGEINQILTEEALKANVSPEIVKAIAYQESGWQQYWETIPDSIKNCKKDPDKGTLAYDGTHVKLGYDCIGVGIMQISNHMYMPEGKEKEAYIKKLKNDIRFNIQEGITILKDKWNYYKNGTIPTVNDNNPMVVENWYFAIMAYNGLLPRNNPLDRAYAAYQEEVFQRIENYSLLEINPFPTYKLKPYQLDNGQLRFENKNVKVEGPQHLSSQSLKKGDTAHVNANGLRIRKTPGGTVIGSFNKGTKVTVTGKYAGNNSRTNQYVWLPVKASNGVSGYVASSYLSPSNDYMDVYRLYGDTRYETSVSVANNGWHWEQPSDVIIGRGDLPIDALTGSVLAASKDSPLLLTQTNKLTASVEKELDRLKPKNIYILGGDKTAISPKVEKKLKKKYGNGSVHRIEGKTRYQTSVNVANEIYKGKRVKEVFIATGDEKSSDALAIAPYAGESKTPILLTDKNKLSQSVSDFLQQKGVEKVTIIGGKVAVSNKVEKQLGNLIGAKNVKRVSGDTRFGTSTAIVDKYYDDFDKLFISQGIEIADALSSSPMAAKLKAPIVLTMSNKVPNGLKTWINKKVQSKPNIYFLGGKVAINENTKKQLIQLIK
ncbi:MAG TPA: cell wall-binding repeat-containing protein [Bacillota bacterium]|nr:cell wall-binding repeat-containing protein [Bacillota bacterium]